MRYSQKQTVERERELNASMPWHGERVSVDERARDLHASSRAREQVELSHSTRASHVTASVLACNSKRSRTQVPARLASRANKQLKLGSISTSETELKDIIKAWIVISTAFAILLSKSIFSPDFYAKFIISSLTVGIGFLLHELGHKIVAQRYGCFAEFRSFDSMLLLAMAMSFFGFIFAAPGAVMISERVDEERNGKISAAGPIVNLILALLFLILTLASLPGLFGAVAYYGFMINSWLALFNMIPFWLFDGQKILKWNKIVYGSIVAVASVFMLLLNFIVMPK